MRSRFSLPAFALIVVVLGYCASAHAAAKYKVLYDLPYPDDGVAPGVTVDEEGNLYGASGNGGTGNCRYGCGLVFELSPGSGGTWSYAELYDFTGGSDGAYPNGNLVVDASGNLWGASDGGGTQKVGEVFELTPGAGGWSETVIFNFCDRQGCPAGPQSGVIMDPVGNLYGTADEVAFQLSPGAGRWKEAMLHRFRVRKGDGSGPYAGLILDAAGNLYGTTSYGGSGCGGEGCGTVYELSPKSGGKWKETILHHFDNNGNDGYLPASPVSMDPSGSLYGTTEAGGAAAYGRVFKLSKQQDGRWGETILYNFTQTDLGPGGGVVMDAAGNLYGAATGGAGGCNCGVIYKLCPGRKGKWVYTALHTFSGSDGACLRAISCSTARATCMAAPSSAAPPATAWSSNSRRK